MLASFVLIMRKVIVGGVLAVALAIVGGVFAMSRDNEPGVTETTSATFNEERERHVAQFVLDDVQQTWREIFARAGKHYESAQLVLYRNETKPACGFGEAATGPFFCPSDDRVYIDLAFDDELANRFGARGDAAQAYVLAHEIGHHVQKLLGAAAIVRAFRRDQQPGQEGANVRLELQADCYAGIWAHTTDKRGLLDAGNIQFAMNAAATVGRDRLQRMSTGHVLPETFTHGTWEQRVRWFNAGYESGMVDSCDTFSASGL